MSFNDSFPQASFLIDSENKEKDTEIIVSFLEGITELRKNQIKFDLRIRSGSLDVYVQILRDIFENPVVAEVTSKAVGIIMQKALDNKNHIKKIKYNKSWDFGRKLHQFLNKNPRELKLTDIRKNNNTIIIKFTDTTNGNHNSYSVDLNDSEAVFTNYEGSRDVINEEDITKPVEMYCVKCRAKRSAKNMKRVKLKNGRPATKGICPKCGTNMFRIGKIN